MATQLGNSAQDGIGMGDGNAPRFWLLENISLTSWENIV